MSSTLADSNLVLEKIGHVELTEEEKAEAEKQNEVFRMEIRKIAAEEAMVRNSKLIHDSDGCLIYEKEGPSPSDKNLRCRRIFEYREMENGNRPVTKQQLMAELKKLKHEIENCRLLTILSGTGFTKAAVIYCLDNNPGVHVCQGDLDSVRHAHWQRVETSGGKRKNETSDDH